MKETEETDFDNLLLQSTLTCLVTDTLPLYGFFKSWNSIVIKRKKKWHYHQRRICVTRKLEKQLLRFVSCTENYFPKLCKISRKVSIMVSNGNSNVAGAALLKSPSAVDILLPILEEFRNIFLKKLLTKAAEATCTCFIVMTLHSSSHQRCSIKIAILKNSAIFTEKPLCWSLLWIKLQGWRPATLLKRDFNTGVFL